MTLDPGAGMTEQLVRLPDGRRLRTVTAGYGDGPLVVFEAGMSGPASTWLHTQREISAHCRTLSYDRAGYGGSDVDVQDRTLPRIVEDLTALLDAVNGSAPVVLVGHSWGGPILRLFSDRHPERVAGLVFIDATLSEGMPVRNAKLAPRSFAVMAFLARVGAANLLMKLSLPGGLSPEISAADTAILKRDYACVSAMRTGRREALHILASLPLLHELQNTGTPAVPTICVQGGRVDRGMAKVRPALNQASTELMAAATDGRVIVVEEAGHLVPQEAPGPVRAAILEIVRAAQVAG